MYAIDQTSRGLKNLVIAAGTDRLMVEVGAAVVDISGIVTIDLVPTNAKLQTLIDRTPDKSAPWQYAGPGIVNSTVAVVMKAAEVGLKNKIESVQLSSIGGTGQHEITILSAANVIWRGAVNMQDNSPFEFVFPTPLTGNTNEAISIKMATVDPGTLYVSAQGYVVA